MSHLVALKKRGATVTCHATFRVLPVDFQQRKSRFSAHVFMGFFGGEVDGRAYAFRKCYARGCSHNLCPHVSQAVMIANRYLQKDYLLLKAAGIPIEEKLFTLEDMLVRFEEAREEGSPALTLDDYIHRAEEGTEVAIALNTEYVPAVEHFADYENAQTFLMAHFAVTCLGRTHELQSCMACYPTESEKEERASMATVANARLEALYHAFARAGIRFQKVSFS